MIQLFASICALLAFSAAILVGLFTGAAPADLIPKAVTALVGGYFLGTAAAWIGMHIIRDQTQPDEATIDNATDDPSGDADVTIVGS